MVDLKDTDEIIRLSGLVFHSLSDYNSIMALYNKYLKRGLITLKLPNRFSIDVALQQLNELNKAAIRDEKINEILNEEES